MPGSNGSRVWPIRGARSGTDYHRVILLSDRSEWVGSVCESLHSPAISVERATWDQIAAIRPPFTALVADLVPPFGRRLTALNSLGHEGWHRVSICVVAGELGATAAAKSLRRTTFEVIRGNDFAASAPTVAILAPVQAVIADRTWLVPRLMDALACADSTLVRYLEAALTLPPRRTVAKWAEPLGLGKPQQISTTFRNLGLPPAKTVLSWALLTLLIVRAIEEDGKTYEEFAKDFGYVSGDYLARHGKNLTGRSLGELIHEGIDGALEVMARQLSPPSRRLKVHSP